MNSIKSQPTYVPFRDEVKFPDQPNADGDAEKHENPVAC